MSPLPRFRAALTATPKEPTVGTIQPASEAHPAAAAVDPASAAVTQALLLAGRSPEDLLSRLAGGASTRAFFRVRWGESTAIAMHTPSPSQELAKARQSGGYGSFVEVACLLRDYGIRVPRIFHTCGQTPVLFVEDLGDVTLARFLETNPDEKEAIYRSVVQDLAVAQRALSELPVRSIVRTRAFDAELLTWEMNHFADWALASQGHPLDPAEQRVFDEAVQWVASEIASWPRVFVHRDFQSRNLMVHADDGDLRLTWIDFQDAMMGPRVYDLVALLSDSYQVFSESFVEARLREYCAELELDEADVLQMFLLVTVQRKLKDAGRFVFLDRVNGNDHFLRFVDGSIDKARRALERLDGPAQLRALAQLLNDKLGSTRMVSSIERSGAVTP